MAVVYMELWLVLIFTNCFFCLFFPDVMMSARGLIQLFRKLNPQMLQKKDRVSNWKHCSPTLNVFVNRFSAEFALPDNMQIEV